MLRAAQMFNYYMNIYTYVYASHIYNAGGQI